MRGVLAASFLLLAACRGETRGLNASARSTDLAEPICAPGLVAIEGGCVDATRSYIEPGGVTRVVDAKDPRATDEGPGTADRPWRTISRAARRGALRPGDAVLIREGVYRESVRPESGGTAEARVTYAAYPGETVVITGADLANEGWAQQPDGSWRRDWTGPALPTYSDDPVFRREMVVAGGRVLQPVARRDDLSPGTTWVEGPDTAPRAVYARFEEDVSPSGAGAIEIATRRRLFDPVGQDPYSDCSDPTAPGWFRIVGLTLRHAANRAQWGALCAGSEGAVVEDVRVEWTIGLGVDGSGRGHVFRRVEADHNGQAGWGASCVSCLFEDGTARDNNWRGHDLFWEAGGGKWNETRDTILRRMVATGNNGPGLWLDGQNVGNTIEDCLVADNEGAGIMLELETTQTLVQHNVVRSTRWREWTGTGILSQAASRNVILHNTVVGNEGTGIWIRLDPLRRAPDGGNVILHNWVAGNAADETREAREIAIEGHDLASGRSNRLDGNAYGTLAGDSVLRSAFFLAVGDEAAGVRSNDLAVWRRVIAGDRSSVQVVDNTPDRLYPVSRSTQLRNDVGARGAGVREAPHIGATRKSKVHVRE